MASQTLPSSSSFTPQPGEDLKTYLPPREGDRAPPGASPWRCGDGEREQSPTTTPNPKPQTHRGASRPHGGPQGHTCGGGERLSGQGGTWTARKGPGDPIEGAGDPIGRGGRPIEGVGGPIGELGGPPASGAIQRAAPPAAPSPAPLFWGKTQPGRGREVVGGGTHRPRHRPRA